MDEKAASDVQIKELEYIYYCKPIRWVSKYFAIDMDVNFKILLRDTDTFLRPALSLLLLACVYIIRMDGNRILHQQPCHLEIGTSNNWFYRYDDWWNWDINPFKRTHKHIQWELQKRIQLLPNRFCRYQKKYISPEYILIHKYICIVVSWMRSPSSAL